MRISHPHSLRKENQSEGQRHQLAGQSLSSRLQPSPAVSSGSAKVTLVMVGLDNAGKTATVRGIQGEMYDVGLLLTTERVFCCVTESPEDVAPTVGFSKVDLKQGKFEVTIFDLGGGKRIRSFQLGESSAPERWDVVESRRVERLGSTAKVKPQGELLERLANKQDRDGALAEADIIENLSLEKLVNENKCLCQIEPCSAVLGYGKKGDKSIKNGLNWLLNNIAKDYEAISERVQKDTAEQRVQEEQEKKARQERVRRIREERDRQEKEEAEREGRTLQEEETDDDAIPSPFQPIGNVINENEERLKNTQRGGQEGAANDAGEGGQEEEEEEEEEGERQTPESGAASASVDQTKKKTGKLRLKRKHKVDPLRTDETAAPESSKPPPLPVGWATPKMSRLPKLEPLGDRSRSEFFGKPLPPVANRQQRPNSDTHDVIS
ncbi:unnamed protein product [Coregonus sp. 'balchen']|nr:unnamed protein product [Coregonus sp. 'balchen']